MFTARFEMNHYTNYIQFALQKVVMYKTVFCMGMVFCLPGRYPKI